MWVEQCALNSSISGRLLLEVPQRFICVNSSFNENLIITAHEGQRSKVRSQLSLASSGLTCLLPSLLSRRTFGPATRVAAIYRDGDDSGRETHVKVDGGCEHGFEKLFFSGR